VKKIAWEKRGKHLKEWGKNEGKKCGKNVKKKAWQGCQKFRWEKFGKKCEKIGVEKTVDK